MTDSADKGLTAQQPSMGCLLERALRRQLDALLFLITFKYQVSPETAEWHTADWSIHGFSAATGSGDGDAVWRDCRRPVPNAKPLFIKYIHLNPV